MNKKIDINKFNNSITFQNRGIGFTQIGVAGEILNLIDDLQQENKILKENAENNDKVVDKVNWENTLLKKENEKLKGNWNKLKEIAKSQSGFKKRADLKGGLWFEVDDLLNKMKELQGSDNK